MKFKRQQTEIEIEIDRLLKEMEKYRYSDPEAYRKMAESVEILSKANANNTQKLRVSADTLATIGCNILGIVLVLGFERTGIITSKAFGSIFKGRAK